MDWMAKIPMPDKLVPLGDVEAVDLEDEEAVGKIEEMFNKTESDPTIIDDKQYQKAQVGSSIPAKRAPFHSHYMQKKTLGSWKLSSNTWIDPHMKPWMEAPSLDPMALEKETDVEDWNEEQNTWANHLKVETAKQSQTPEMVESEVTNVTKTPKEKTNIAEQSMRELDNKRTEELQALTSIEVADDINKKKIHVQRDTEESESEDESLMDFVIMENATGNYEIKRKTGKADKDIETRGKTENYECATYGDYDSGDKTISEFPTQSSEYMTGALPDSFYALLSLFFFSS